jgi:hypothetical protein
MILYSVSARLSPEDCYPTLLESFLKKEDAISYWESILDKHSEVYLTFKYQTKEITSLKDRNSSNN